jgi:hypothetical protein
VGVVSRLQITNLDLIAAVTIRACQFGIGT